MHPPANAGRNVFTSAVGYSTINIGYKYNIIGVNFNGVSQDAMDINDIFPFKEGMTQGGSEASADQIQVRVGNGYEIYYLSNGKSGKTTRPELVGKWVKNDATSVAATRTFKSGDGFWYISAKSNDELKNAPYSVTVAGSVLMDGEKEADLSGLYSIISSPYPVDIPLNGGVIPVNGTEGGSEASADQIQIRVGDGYDIYYLSNGKSGKTTRPELVGKWVKNDATSVATENTLPAGKGCWFIRQKEETSVKFANPIAK